ncbi:MAG: suppressor of fused domain protein [Devosia sp.]|nr:suppressor of fused domain protein [Devosia sp.]
MSEPEGPEHSSIVGRMLGAATLPAVSDELEPFLQAAIGGSFSVLHEIASDYIHLDVLVFPPNSTSPCWTFVSSGVSSKPMRVQGMSEAERYQFAEVVLKLPPDWFSVASNGLGMEEDELRDQAKYWPIGVLSFVGRAPHQYGFWIGQGHSLPNGDPPDTYTPDVPFSGLVLEAVEGWRGGMSEMTTSIRRTINFLALNFVYPDEMDFKLQAGAEALREKMRKAKVGQILSVGRQSVMRG